MNFKRTVFCLLAGFYGVCMTGSIAFSQPDVHEVILISTNDVHGRINNFSKMAAYVTALKKDHPDVFVFNAGDLINGNPVVDEAADKGYPMVDLMNNIPYDISCPGNHEFENGEENLQRRISQSTSVYVCANMTMTETSPLRPLKPYYILHTHDGTSLAVLGLTTGGSNPCMAKNVTVSDPVKKALEYSWLRKDNAVFIGLTHIGYKKDSLLAMQMKELDVIVGGHSHTELPHGLMVNGVLITQTGDKLRYIGKTILKIKDHQVVGKSFEMIDLAMLTDKDVAVQAKIDTYNNNSPFGDIVGEASAAFVNKEELGDLKTDAMTAVGRLDIAFDHVRNVATAGLPKGPIHLGDLYMMDPFDYKVIRYEMKAAGIRAMILRELNKENTPHLFVSGMSYTLEKDPAGVVKSVILKDKGGRLLDEERLYSVGMNSYIACHFMPGVDGGTTLDNTPVELLIKYLALHKNVDYSNVQRIFN